MTHGPGSRRAAVPTAIGAGYRASARTMLAMTSACGAGSTSGRSAWNGRARRLLLLFGSVPPAQRPDFSSSAEKSLESSLRTFLHSAPRPHRSWAACAWYSCTSGPPSCPARRLSTARTRRSSPSTATKGTRATPRASTGGPRMHGKIRGNADETGRYSRDGTARAAGRGAG